MKSLKRYTFLVVILLAALLAGCQPLSSGPVIQESVSNTRQSSGILTMWMLDVGQGDCLLFKSPSGRFLLVDGGPTDSGPAVQTELNQLGVQKIDALVVSHVHEDHIGGLDNVLTRFPAEKAYLPKMVTTTRSYEDMWLQLKRSNTEVIYPQAGNEITWDR